jgi:hypothetical protein
MCSHNLMFGVSNYMVFISVYHGNSVHRLFSVCDGNRDHWLLSVCHGNNDHWLMAVTL